MGVLPKAKDEKLAQNLAKGAMTKQAACKDAGFSTDPAAITKKTTQSHIVERVAELHRARSRVLERIQEQEIEHSASVAKRLGISKEKIIQALWFNAQRCLRGTPELDANGVQTGKYKGKPDATGANQALKLIGMECFGMFVEKLEIGGPGDFSRLSDEEFNAKLQEEALAVGLPEDAVAGLLEYKPAEPEDESQK